MLRKILDQKTREVAERKVSQPIAALERACRSAPPVRDFEAALRGPRGEIRVIAEVKKASPSRGLLAPSFDPVALATTYAAHGAAAISVLTDETFFQGHLDHLRAVRAAAPLPVLRKDFTIDEYQLWEARAAGADAVLLIVAALEAGVLAELLRAAKGLDLTPLVEVHTREELEVAAAAGARVIGINNRDLTTFRTRIETTLDLIPLVPPGAVVVSESGFSSGADVRRVAGAGAHAVLVGEALVTAADLPAKLRELSLAAS